MFIIEDIEVPVGDTGKMKEEGKITQLKSFMDFENFIRLDSIDYDEVMNKEQPLLSRDTEVINSFNMKIISNQTDCL